MLSKLIKITQYSTNIDISNPDEINAFPTNHNTTNNNVSARNKSFFQNQNNKENEDKNQRKKSTISDFFHFPFLKSDQTHPFNFKNASWALTINYLTAFILIPIFFSLIKRYGFHVSSDNTTSEWNLVTLFFQFLLPLLSFVIAIAIDPVRMLKKHGYLAYLNFIILGIVGFISALFFAKPADDYQQTINSIITFWIQIGFQISAAAIVIMNNKQLKAQLVSIFKEAKIQLLLVVICAFALIQVLDLIFNIINKQVNNPASVLSNLMDGKSSNQKALEAMMKIWYGAFALVVGTIFAAPLSEELTFRFGLFSVVRYRWLAYVAALVYFPSMHVMDRGDWNHIFGYLAFSFVVPFCFILGRGNVWYTIAIHSSSNALSVILMFSGNNS